jgi:tungstate transport system substrate-binding protein
MSSRSIRLIALGITLAVCAVAWRPSLVGASQATEVRLALVPVPEDVLGPLLPKFQAQTGIKASIVYTGRDPFGFAREGKADLVVSHYGHEGVEPFVMGGFGIWPHPVFANQIVLLGPSSDPARVRGLTDPVEAFRRIARSKARFVVNDSPGLRYVEDIIAAGAGEARSWELYTNRNVQGLEAAREADKLQGYLFWGLPPYLRLKREGELKALEPLVVSSPLFQRIMVSIVVDGAKVKGVNMDAARKFERFLLSAETQAAIEAFRYPDFPHQAWWAAGRHNSSQE